MVKASDLMVKNFLKVSTKQSLSEVIGKIKQSEERIAVVFDGSKIKGELDRRKLLKSKLDPKTIKLSSLTKAIPSVKPDADIIRVAELMFNSYPTVIAVKQNNALIGIIRPRDLIAHISDFPDLLKIKIKEVMTKDVIQLKETDRLGNAINLMKEKGIGRIPIVKANENISSIISVTDIIKKISVFPKKKLGGSSIKKGTRSGINTPRRLNLLDMKLDDFASSNVVTLPENRNIGAALELMKKHKLSDVVITKQKKVRGILSYKDLINALLTLKKPEYWGIAIYGVDALKPMQEKGLRNQINVAYEKIRRVYFNNVIYFLIHVKRYEEGFAGKAKRHGRTKWVVRARLATPSKLYVTHGQSFNLSTSASHALKKLEMNVQKYQEHTDKNRKYYEGKHPKGRRAAYEKYISDQLGSDDRGRRRAYSKLVKR